MAATVWEKVEVDSGLVWESDLVLVWESDPWGQDWGSVKDLLGLLHETIPTSRKEGLSLPLRENCNAWIAPGQLAVFRFF